MKRLFLLGLSALFLTMNAGAITLTGTISTDTRLTLAEAPHSVSGNVTIAAGVTLTVDPGVNLLFASGGSMTVLGTLSATQAVFTTTAASWNSIQVGNATEPGALVLNETVLEKGGSTTSTGMIHVMNGTVAITGGSLTTVTTNNVRAIYAVAGTININGTSITAASGYPLLISGADVTVGLKNATLSTNHASYSAITFEQSGNLNYLEGNTLQDNVNRVNASFTAVNNTCTLPKIPVPYNFTSAVSVNAGGNLNIASGNSLTFANTITVKGAFKANGISGERIVFNKTSTGNIFEVSEGGTLHLTYSDVNALAGIRTNAGTTVLTNSTLKATAGNGLIIGNENADISLAASSVTASDKDVQFLAGGDIRFDSFSSLTGSNANYTFEFSSLNSEMNLPLMPKAVVVPNNFTINTGGVWNIAPGNAFNTGLIKISGTMNAPAFPGSQTTFVSTAGIFNVLAGGTLNASNLLINAAGSAFIMDGGTATTNNCIFNLTAGDGIVFNGASNLTVSNTSFSLAANTSPVSYAVAGTLNWGAGNSISGGRNHVRITTYTLSGYMYLPTFPLPYVFTTGYDFTVTATGKLEIGPNNIIKFANRFLVYGELKAEAATGETILFTSANDDNAGGNTTGVAPDVPKVGSWGGILFDGAASSVSSLKNCELRFGGKSNRGIIIVDNQASPTIENCNLKNSYYGFELQRGAKPVLKNNNIGASQVVPLAMTLDCNPTMQNNVFSTSNNQYDAIGILPSTLSYDAHIIKRDFISIPNVTYLLLGTVINPEGKTLTIDPGIVIKAKAAYDQICNFGTLKAIGTATEKIIFTSVHDDSCGNPADTGSDGNTGVPAAGNWSGIYFGNTTTTASELNHCVIKYAINYNIGSSYNGGAVSMQNASPVIRNTKISMTTYGIAAIQASNPTIQDVTIETTSSVPVAVSMTANPAFTNLTYNNAAIHAIGIFSETIGVSGTLLKKTLAGYDNITYYLLGDITIASGTNVTVDAGVVIKLLGASRAIFVDGGFKIAGTASEPVIFTSVNDDSYGNPKDTRMDGNTVTPRFGDWSAIVYRATSNDAFNEINHAKLLYGGGTQYGAYTYGPRGVGYAATLHFYNASPTVKNTLITVGAGDPIGGTNAAILVIGTAAPVLTENVVFEGDGFYPIVMSITADPKMNLNSPLFNTTRKGIYLTNEIISTAITLNKRSVSGFDNIPYITGAYYTNSVAAGGVLTISPGIILKYVGGYDAWSIEGALKAEGTETEPIVFTSEYDDAFGGDTDGTTTAPNSATNGWESIVFKTSATQNQNSLKHCIFAYGSGRGGNEAGMVKINNSYVNIENCRFENANWQAITIIGNSNPIIKDCRFTNINYVPIQLSMFSNPVFQGNNVLTNVAIRALGIRNETYGVDGTFPKRNFGGYDNISYYIESNADKVVINSGTHITIPAGIVIKQPSYSGGSSNADGASFAVNGKLTIAGTAAEPVVFTHLDDDNYGNPRDTRSNGNTPPAPGTRNYTPISFKAVSDDASSINYAVFAYGTLAIHLTSSSPAITNSRFENTTFGIWLAGASNPTINNCVFHNITYSPTMQSLRSNIITSDNATTSGNVISGTTYRALGVAAEELTQNHTLKKKAFAGLANIPYYFNAYYDSSSPTTTHISQTSVGYRIGTSATLTVEPGVICKFDSYYSFMVVKGGLKALGTPAEKVIFTSLADDFYGGDTDANGALGAYSWSGITFSETSIKENSIIDHAVIRYATGYGSTAGITTDKSHPTITNSAIYDCRNGLVINGASNPVINNCDIYNITDYAVNNVTKVFTIDAKNNWWGNNSGPKHTGNPEGAGTTVSDMVNYSPFITTGTANPIPGDVSLNGLVQAYDASLVLQHTVGNITLAGAQLVAADVSGDGTIGAMDASLILMYVAGTNSTFPTLKNAVLPEGELTLKTGEIVYNGNRITVPFNLVNAHNIRSAEWTAAYDNRALRPVSVEGCNGAMSAYRIDEANGELLFAMARESALNGNANLVTVTFEVLTGDATTVITTGALNIDETDRIDAAPSIVLSLNAPSGINNASANPEPEIIQIGSSLEIRFANAQSENVQIALCDMNGRTLAGCTTSGDNATIEVPSISGVYIVRIIGGNMNVSKKIVVR